MNPDTPIRVALVEDDPLIRESVASLMQWEQDLELLGVFPNGETAIANLPALGPDIVLMDISMPGMTGIECVRDLAARMADTQFLMYTMHDDDHRVFEALKAGANGYLLKTSTPDEIIDAIKELRQGGAPMSTAVARRVVSHFRPLQARTDLGAEKLSDREYTVLELLAQGLLYKEIAERMSLSTGTVKQHIHRMYRKLHVQNRVEAVNKYYGR